MEPMSKNLEMVVVIGPPKCGKTIFIKHLLGEPLLNRWQRGGQGTIELANPSNMPNQPNPINHGLFPTKNWQIWEFSGFADDEELSKLKECLRKFERVRFVVVVPHPWISEQSGELYKLLFNIQSLHSNLGRSICLVCTKFTEDWITTVQREFYPEFVSSIGSAIDPDILNGKAKDELIDNEYEKKGREFLSVIAGLDQKLYFKTMAWEGERDYVVTNDFAKFKIENLIGTPTSEMKLDINLD